MRDPRPLIAASLLAAVAAMPAGCDEYSIDPGRSEMVVKIFKAGLASGLAHDHVIRASEFAGTVVWNPGQPTAAQIEIQADARALVVDEPEVRARYQVEGELSDDKRRDVRETMESAKQLDVQAHPDMAFHSTSVRATGDGSIEVTGDLTLHGVTRSISFRTSPVLVEGTLSAEAEIDFLQSDFGIKPYTAMLGAVKNQDGAKLLVRLVATPVAADQSSSAGPGQSDE
jgi:polyisoprenoid-binding protein YceI